MSKQPEIGPKREAPAALEPRIKALALVQLIATVTLALSTLIAATAVSIGLARADVAPTVTGAAPFAITLPPADGGA